MKNLTIVRTKKRPYDLLIKNKIAGEYMYVVNEGTEREVRSDWFDNLVLDAGLNRLGLSGQNAVQWCSVGTGTTAPNVSQTSLAAHLASTQTLGASNIIGNLGASTYAGRITKQFQFTQGAVVGVIAELGVGWATGGGSLFSRTLIVDGVGTPTTLTLTAIDQLTIYYRVTVTPVITDLTSSVVISGITYNYVARLSSATSYCNDLEQFLNNGGPTKIGQVNSVFVYGTGSVLGAITGQPTGSSLFTTSTNSDATYVNGNFYRDVTLVIGPTQGNSTGGIKCMQLTFALTSGIFQWEFTPIIPKDNTKTLTLNVRFAWGR